MSNYKGPQYNYIVPANTIVAADVVLDAGVLSFGVPAATGLRPICDYQDLIPGKNTVTASVAKVWQETTVTFTAVANTTYTLKITQWDPVARKNIYRVYTYTSAASGDTANDISDEFRNQINADAGIYISTNAMAAATLILTAEDRTVTIDGVSVAIPYATFIVTNIEPVATSVVTGTAGVNPIGTTATLALKGITVAAGMSFTTVHLEYNANGIPTNSLQTNQPYVLDIYIDQASADLANTVAKFRYLLAGRMTSIGGPANPEAIAVA